MWNKFAEILQDPSYKRLGIAICISAILHTFLFEGFEFTLPNISGNLYPIEARIQLAKLTAAQPEKSEEAVVAPKPTLVKQPKLNTTPIIEDASLQENTTEQPVEPATEAVEIPEEITNSLQQAESAESQLVQEQQSDVALVMNENAYRYVETDFEVRTEAEGSVQGFAKITHEAIEGNLYHLSFLIEPKGVAALFVANLLQTSKGSLTSLGLQPNTYAYQYGDKIDKSRTANFDWRNKKLELITSKGSRTEDLPDGTQDLLSFMYQFMYVPPLQKMQINIANGKKLEKYDYGFEGEEVIYLPIGEIRTIHIVHTGADPDEKTDLWLAIDYQHLPVKIVKTEKEGRYYEFIATRINTNRPTVNE